MFEDGDLFSVFDEDGAKEAPKDDRKQRKKDKEADKGNERRERTEEQPKSDEKRSVVTYTTYALLSIQEQPDTGTSRRSDNSLIGQGHGILDNISNVLAASIY